MWASLRRRLAPGRGPPTSPPSLSRATSDGRDAYDLGALFSAASPDVGTLPGEKERKRKLRPTLVEGGKNAGASRVVYQGHNIPLHLFTKDFFISVVQINTGALAAMVAGIYLCVFLFWSLPWWLIVRYYPGCLYGAETYVEALTFSVVTQMTIGYGNTGPQSCWAAAWVIIAQSIAGLVLEAVTIGIVFARISHPHQRSRSIFMSNKAVVARRDGILKFMFRVADIRNTQVVEPKVKAYVYTWGDGRITAEGERIPVRVEPLDVDYIDGMLLLPLIIEHTIDERSPLCGHTHTSLLALSAEIVVTFEGTTEMGNPFMARRSYVPDEIYWGHQFKNVVKMPAPRSGATQYEVRLDSFHEVEPQKDMPKLLPSQLSQLVVNRAKRTVPYPLLGENTLVLSDVVCVAPDAQGRLCVHCRVGDTYPNQMLEIIVRMYLYRWSEPGAEGGAPGGETFEQFSLDCGYEAGNDRLHLRLPALVSHVITDASPLAAWREPGGIEADSHSEIVVVLNAYMNVNNEIRLRQRTYAVDHHLRYGYTFRPMVKHPKLARDRKPRVRWQHFHDVQPAAGMEPFPQPPAHGRLALTGPAAAAAAAGGATVLAVAPESHANLRSIASMMNRSSIYPSANMGNSAMDMMMQNDFTVLPTNDLQRYAAAVGNESFRVDTQRGRAAAEAVARAEAARAASGDEAGGSGAGAGGAALFPQVMRFAEATTDASDSLPHPAALHPALPGSDRFMMATDEGEGDLHAEDYTVLPMDLSRYASRMNLDSLPHGRSAAFTPLPADFRETAAAAAAAAESESAAAAAAETESALSGSGALPSSEGAGGAPVYNAEAEAEAAMRSLAGVHPIGRTASRAALGEYFGEEAAGPMHFATGQAWRKGSALRDIKSLFGVASEGEEPGSRAQDEPNPKLNGAEEQA